jgi:transposase-like protein
MADSGYPPITPLLDLKISEAWLIEQLHPSGFRCVHCGAEFNQARIFRQAKRTCLLDYRCKQCSGVYNLYSGTIFAHKQLRPQQVVILLHGIRNGVSLVSIASEIGVSWRTVHNLRRGLAKHGSVRRRERTRDGSNGKEA